MTKRNIVIAIIAAIGLLLCVLAYGKAQQPFPRPVDVGAVRMHFVGSHMTLYVPSDKFTTKPGMDNKTTVIEIDTSQPIITPGK